MEKALDELIIPQHVALILDGNGRWAKKRGLPRTAGHKQGCVTVEKTVEEGDIILLHDGSESSVEAALRIIDDLTAEGYQFVTVEEMLLE